MSPVFTTVFYLVLTFSNSWDAQSHSIAVPAPYYTKEQCELSGKEQVLTNPDQVTIITFRCVLAFRYDGELA